ISDVLQYVWGKTLGKHPIAPTVSPNKTWEGFLGGIASAVLLGTALYWATPFKPLQAAGMSLVITLMGFIGGLTMSAIKRDLGVSTDSVKSHGKFAEKFSLKFPLLSDEEKKIVNAYGVWGQKSFMGRKYMGTNRVTFLIGPDGRIVKIWPQVKPEQHPVEVLA